MSESIKPNKPDTTFIFRPVEEKGDQVTFEVTPEDYARDLAAGLADEETLRPGRYTATRGGFQKRHPEFRPGLENASLSDCKVKITMYLDADILQHFKARAAVPHAAPYQTQINTELRAVMEHDQTQATSENVAPYAGLLDDEQFLAKLAAKLKALAPKKPRRRAA